MFVEKEVGDGHSMNLLRAFKFLQDQVEPERTHWYFALISAIVCRYFFRAGSCGSDAFC